jgi:hypothetical protein
MHFAPSVLVRRLSDILRQRWRGPLSAPNNRKSNPFGVGSECAVHDGQQSIVHVDMRPLPKSKFWQSYEGPQAEMS